MSDNKHFCPDCGSSWMYCPCENNPLNKSEPSQDDTTDKEIKSKYTTIHEALEAAKNTKTVRYKVKGARMICDTCEYKDYSTDELPCSRCTPDSRSYREAKREPSQDDKHWTTEPPTEPGWYWVKGYDPYNPPTGEQVWIDEVVIRPGHKYLAITGLVAYGIRDFTAVKKMGAKWCGPIKEQK